MTRFLPSRNLVAVSRRDGALMLVTGSTAVMVMVLVTASAAMAAPGGPQVVATWAASDHQVAAMVALPPSSPAPATPGPTLDRASVTASAAGVVVRSRFATVLSDTAAVALVLPDSSEVAPDLRGGLLSAATDFLLQRPGQTRTGVVADRSPPKVVAPASVGVVDDVRAISTLTGVGAGATVDAIALATEQVLASPAASTVTSRVLVLATGDVPTGPAATAVAERLRAAGVVLAVVDASGDPAYWTQAATTTGGVAVSVRRPGGAFAAFEELRRALEGRLLVTFDRPPDWVDTARLDITHGGQSTVLDVALPTGGTGGASAGASTGPPRAEPPAGPATRPSDLRTVTAAVAVAALAALLLGGALLGRTRRRRRAERAGDRGPGAEGRLTPAPRSGPGSVPSLTASARPPPDHPAPDHPPPSTSSSPPHEDLFRPANPQAVHQGGLPWPLPVPVRLADVTRLGPEAALDGGPQAAPEAVDVAHDGRDVDPPPEGPADPAPGTEAELHDLAVAYVGQAESDRAHDRVELAAAGYRQAVQALSERLRLEPTNPWFVHDLAVALRQMADLDADQGWSAQSLSGYAQAVRLGESLVSVEPQAPAWRHELALARALLAETTAQVERERPSPGE